MKAMAIGTLKPLSPEQRQRYLPREVPATLQLYLDGKMEQFWLREKEEGVIFLMSVDSVDEADRLLQALPLVRDGLLTFDLTGRQNPWSKPGKMGRCPGFVRACYADRPPAAAWHVDESEIATRRCVLRTCQKAPVEPLPSTGPDRHASRVSRLVNSE